MPAPALKQMDDECTEYQPAEHVPADAARTARRVPTRPQAQPSPRPPSSSHARAALQTPFNQTRPAPALELACSVPALLQVDGVSAEDRPTEVVTADGARAAPFPPQPKPRPPTPSHNPNPNQTPTRTTTPRPHYQPITPTTHTLS